MDTLMKCDCYFIRCLKSNTKKQPLVFQTDLCLDQIRALGILEKIKVMKESYPVRRIYKFFFDKYMVLSKNINQIEKLEKENADFKSLSIEYIL